MITYFIIKIFENKYKTKNFTNYKSNILTFSNIFFNNSTNMESVAILNLTAQQYFESFLDSQLIDLIYLYVTSSVSFIGSILGLICVWIFHRRKEFDQPFFIFYKILSINSFLHDFMGIWFSLCRSNWYISFKYQTVCINYETAFLPFHMLFHNHAILIEIGMLFEMLKLFNRNVKNNFKLEPYKMSIISFIISVIIGASASFIHGPNELIWYNYETITSNSSMIIKKKQTIFFLGPNDFGWSKVGSIYFMVHTFIVHVPLILVQFVSYLAVILVMKKHYSDISLQCRSRSRQLKKKERLNKRTSIMALVLCSLSLISRTVLLVALVSLNISQDFFGYLTLALSDLIIFFNAGVLFFVCFNFNNAFKKQVLALICIRTLAMESTITNSQNNNKNQS